MLRRGPQFPPPSIRKYWKLVFTDALVELKEIQSRTHEKAESLREKRNKYFEESERSEKLPFRRSRSKYK